MPSRNRQAAAAARLWAHRVEAGCATLSIDEIYVGKRRGYYTLVLDLESGRILWVSPGRGKAGLQGFWRRLRRGGAAFSAVAMDMSGAYWAAVLEELPGVAWSSTGSMWCS